MISVPLEMTAAMLLLLWWTWPPLVICAWWWADRSWKWSWVLATEAGVFGTQWAFVGAYALHDFPQSRVLVATLWTAFPAVLAAISTFNHRRSAASARVATS